MSFGNTARHKQTETCVNNLKPENQSCPLHLQLQTHADIMSSKVDTQASKPLMLIDGEVREHSFLVKERH
jgi:hypothetical protein